MPEEKTVPRGLMVAAAVGVALAGRELFRRLSEADLRGEVALITGGSRGLGFLLARELAREGCRLVICARDSRELDAARAELERGGAQVLAVPCDMTDRTQVEELIAASTRHYGRVDLLVNNAGAIEVGPIDAMTIEDFEQAMGLMFWGVLYPTLAVLPQMRERRRGRIVNITSIGGKVSLPHMLPYSCAKFAAVGLSEGLRAELGGSGVQVTTIVPGLMRTGSYLNAQFKGRQEEEFTWFSLSAALPGVTIDAVRAAREIVRAARRGEAERVLSLPANLLARLHGLCPATMIELISLVRRFALPEPEGGSTRAERGQEIQERLRRPLQEKLTAMGREAARRYQHGDVAESQSRSTRDTPSGQRTNGRHGATSTP
jgi:NAD(P)-dependent dehydrogenase (short-subunit alcohol dehydrogenase family)